MTIREAKAFWKLLGLALVMIAVGAGLASVHLVVVRVVGIVMLVAGVVLFAFVSWWFTW